MKVFLKYVRKNMTEKKGRLFLLVFSLMLCTMLLVASMGLINVILDSYVDAAKKAVGDKEIYLVSDTDEIFFDESDFNSDGLKDIEGSLQITGIKNENDEVKYVRVAGMKEYSGKIIEGSFDELKGSECIVSDRIADDYGYKIGSEFNVSINGEPLTLKVKGIAAAEKLFYIDTKNSFSIITSFDFADELLGAGGKFNNMSANASGSSVEKAIEKFNENNEKVKAEKMLSTDIGEAASISSVLYVMLAFVCIVCIILIHGVFKLIVSERLTTIGTFMSQGATYKKIQSILLLEAFLYALIASILGSVLGEVILYFVGRLVGPLKEYGIYPEFKINVVHIIIGFAFTILLSIVSAWSPVRKIRKLQVKDVILNRVEYKRGRHFVRFIFGALFLAFAVAVYLNKGEIEMAVSLLALVAAIAGTLMLIPIVVKFIAGLLSKLFSDQSTIYLALRNIKSEKLLRGNISLIVVSFASVMCVVSAGTSLKSLVVDAYEEMSYDYSVSNILNFNTDKSTTDSLLEQLGELDCIKKDTLCAISDNYGKVNDKDVVVEGIDPANFANYNRYFKFYDSAEYADVYNDFKKSDDNVILISTAFAKKISKDKGDTVEIEMDSKKESFKIIGKFDAGAYDNGLLIIMDRSKMRSIYNIKEATGITFKINGDAAAAEKEFKKIISSYGATYSSRDDDLEMNIKSNQLVVNVLSIFSYLALIIASIGIFNNISICFQQRRKSFAVLASVGMQGGSRKKLIFTESMTCTVISLLVSLSFTELLSKLMSNLMKGIDLPLDISVDWLAIPKFAAALILIIFIASLSAMKSSKNLNVVQELKYE